MRHWLLVGIGIVSIFTLIGCETEPPPDPNDPKEVGLLKPIVMQRQLKWASDAANQRVSRREWSASFAKQKVSEYAEKLLEQTPIDKIPDGMAWEYAEIFRTAQRWKEAIPLFEKAVKEAKSEDRRINDSLRLAHCLAAMGKVDDAVRVARSTFNAPDHETAPLLPAIYLEIVPAGRGKGKDAELARLIKDAVPIWSNTKVDPKTEAGQSFNQAKSFHISRAYTLIRDLEAPPLIL